MVQNFDLICKILQAVGEVVEQIAEEVVEHVGELVEILFFLVVIFKNLQHVATLSTEGFGLK